MAAQVGYKAVDDYVKSGMVVGLGTGSTAAFAGKSASVHTHSHQHIRHTLPIHEGLPRTGLVYWKGRPRLV